MQNETARDVLERVEFYKKMKKMAKAEDEAPARAAGLQVATEPLFHTLGKLLFYI